MKLRYILSFSLLVVYGIVLSHNMMPHHHHFQVADKAEHQHCHNNHDDHSDSGTEEHDHGHTPSHIHCSIEDLTLPGVETNLPDILMLASLHEMLYVIDNEQLLIDSYIIPNYIEVNCRDVHLRGPPLIS